MLELEICHLDLVFGEHQFQDAKYGNVTQPEAWSFLGTRILSARWGTRRLTR